MPEPNATKTEKKTYTRPIVTIVRLVPEEAVLAICKLTAVEGTCSPPNPTCATDGPGS